jgi:folate-binding protein YgfZ
MNELTTNPIEGNDGYLLDVPATERVVLLQQAGLVELGKLRRTRVRGADRFRWLSGMVTNRVQDLAEGEGAWNLVLNSQGRIQGDLEVWRGWTGAASESVASDEVEIQIEASQTERLLAHFDKYIIMDDVELTPVEGVTALGVYGPLAEGVLGAVGIAGMEKPLTQKLFAWKGREVLVRREFGVLVPRYQLWVDAGLRTELCKALMDAGAVPVSFAATEMLRIVEGIPRYGVELEERDLPQESSQMRALNFNKGCYQGQEIVERIRSRGNVHKHLRQVEFMAGLPTPGTTLKFKDADAGIVRSVTRAGGRVFGLAMIRAEAEVPEAVLDYDGGQARVLNAPPALTELIEK